MTWHEFKAAAEAAGITDTTSVWFIDVQGSATGVSVQRHDRLGMALVSASAPAPEAVAPPAEAETTEASEPAPTTPRSRR